MLRERSGYNKSLATEGRKILSIDYDKYDKEKIVGFYLTDETHVPIAPTPSITLAAFRFNQMLKVLKTVQFSPESFYLAEKLMGV